MSTSSTVPTGHNDENNDEQLMQDTLTDAVKTSDDAHTMNTEELPATDSALTGGTTTVLPQEVKAAEDGAPVTPVHAPESTVHQTSVFPTSHEQPSENRAPASPGNTPTGTAPTRVWTANSTAPSFEDRPEAEAQGIRVGQLIWAAIVCLMGIFLIAIAVFRSVNFTLLFIGLIGILGLVLVISAFFVGCKTPKPSKTHAPQK